MTRPDRHPAFRRLSAFLMDHSPPLIAFSGGADSAFLVWAAHRLLGSRMLAVTLRTPYMRRQEIDEAEAFCRRYGIPHSVMSLPMPSSLQNNPRNRCYLCKQFLFSELLRRARDERFCCVMEGSHVGDLQEHRPGQQAIRELGVVSPLASVGLDKDLIRELSRAAGLPTWDKPSNTCLLTRFPYAHPIDNTLLERVEKAETFLQNKGFRHLRVRTHALLARIEVPPDRIGDLVKEPMVSEITRKLKALGYQFVTVDLEGFRSGSYDRTEKKEEHGQ